MVRGHLAVKVDDGHQQRHVTDYARGLRFSKSAPGGHKDASVRLVLPRGFFQDLGPADKLYIYDARNATTVWEGYTERPGPAQGPLGDTYDLRAVGGMALAGDETRPLIYLTRDLGDFFKSTASVPSGTLETGDWLVNPVYQRVRSQITPGAPIGNGSIVAADNTVLRRAGMTLGAVKVYVTSGRNDTNYRATLYTGTGSVDIGDLTKMSTTGVDEHKFAGTDFGSGTEDLVALALRRHTGGATNIATDDVWTDFVDVHILGQRMTRHGVLLSGSGGLVSASSVLAHQVVEDLLGRVLTMCDPTLSTVETTIEEIDQLAYPDGITAAGVLDDLGLWEDYLWEILHSTSSGLHLFNYRAWPTEVRYELTTADGYTPDASDSDLCNRIAVTWTDPTGTRHTEIVTAYVPALDDQVPPRVKDAEAIALPDGVGSQALAQRIGSQVLASLNEPPKAGKAVVRRPVMDLLTGNLVQPWELQPGYLVRLRQTGDVLRLTHMEYVDDDCAAYLTVGQPSLTVDQRAARAARAA
jgi:hypothetical protein